MSMLWEMQKLTQLAFDSAETVNLLHTLWLIDSYQQGIKYLVEIMADLQEVESSVYCYHNSMHVFVD